MIVLGLTGSIGMGKSVTARMFAALGVPVHDADQCVHELLGPGGAGVESAAAAFPDTRAGNAIDRAKLGAIVFHDEAARQRLESLLHPLVRESQDEFLHEHKDAPVTVLDIPLLYETGAEARVDYVVVVSAPHFIQRARVLKRPGMSEEKFRAILNRQMPDREKRKRADFIVQTGLGRAFASWQVRKILRVLSPPSPRTGRRADPGFMP